MTNVDRIRQYKSNETHDKEAGDQDDYVLRKLLKKSGKCYEFRLVETICSIMLPGVTSHLTTSNVLHVAAAGTVKPCSV